MKKSILALAAAAILATAGAASAAQIEGMVTNVDPGAGTLQLSSGQTFHFANGAVLNGVIPGQTVGVAVDGDQAEGVFNPHRAKTDNIDHN